MRRFSVLAALALLVTLVPIGAAPSAGAQAVILVDGSDTASDDTGCGTAENPCNTIQAGVDVAAPGDTVDVADGTYAEHVVVAKQLTLLGEQAGVDARTREASAAESTISGDGASTAPKLSVTAGGVVVDGFTIGGGGGPGLQTVPTASGYTIRNTTFSDNTFGLYLHSEGTSETVVEQNRFSANNRAGSAAGGGIYADQGTNNVLVGQNLFEGQTAGAVTVASAGARNSAVGIVGNVMTGDGTVTFLNTDVVTIAGNAWTETITDKSIQIAEGNTAVTITGNQLSPAGSDGIIFTRFVPTAAPSSGVTITANTIVGRDAAIEVAVGSYQGVLDVHLNRFFENVSAIDNKDVDLAIDAENNWFGCNGGPTDTACDPIVGAGAANVDFDPWLQFAFDPEPAGAVSTGGSTDFGVTTLVNSDGVDLSEGVPGTPDLSFAATRGSVDPTSALLTGGAFSPVAFDAGGFPGTAEVSATLDNATISEDVVIVAPQLPPADPAVLALSDDELSVGEGDGDATVTVVRSGDTNEAATVDYATSDGTATAPEDYEATSGTLTFAAGETSGSFTVPIVDDDLVEGDETVTLTLSEPSEGDELGDPATATLTIVDDDEEAPGDVPAAEVVCPGGAENDFPDVDDDNVHVENIACSDVRDIVRGFADGTFGPDFAVQRDQVASIIARALSALGVDLPAEPANAFDDDVDNVHALAINQLAEVGIINGRAPRAFEPDSGLRRDQLTAILVRAHEYASGTDGVAAEDHFGDDGDSVHEPDINLAFELGITEGVTDTRFDPDGIVTRDQMASFATRLAASLIQGGFAPAA